MLEQFDIDAQAQTTINPARVAGRKLWNTSLATTATTTLLSQYPMGGLLSTTSCAAILTNDLGDTLL